MAVQFFAGFLTEYSRSVDNLFVFGVVMTSFAVPAAQQVRVLLIGIAALVRGPPDTPALIGSGDNRNRHLLVSPYRAGADTGVPSRLTAAEQ
ncbi:hypothetical protein [Nonomuraea wenchangensis]|uniref:hypothetical protein n=2 Tax=Nonomuraea wenchangensis TaxID=568860 RepID=UPI00341CDA22